MSVILDAGPSLNFLAVGQQSVLIKLAAALNAQLCAPERVASEVLGKSRDRLFARTPVAATWRKLTSSGRIVILDDDISPAPFARAISRISGAPAATRIRDKDSLGEILVLAHASVLAQAGEDVFVLIDDRDGRRRAEREIEHLRRTSASGSLTLWSTRQVLSRADPAWIDGGLTWQTVYKQMLPFDDGLPR